MLRDKRHGKGNEKRTSSFVISIFFGKERGRMKGMFIIMERVLFLMQCMYVNVRVLESKAQ
jgi:hypothetical protein